jgi:protein-disulfide isomerase
MNVSENISPDECMMSRRHALKAGAGAAVLAASTLTAVSSISGVGSRPAHAAPSESELLADAPLPENVLGKTTAPNTIIEYASMTCGHCASFHKDIFPDLQKKYIDTGKARLLFREFPLDRMAFAASMLARCAGPEKYFPFIKVLFDKQEVWAFGEGDPVERLFAMAKQAGFTRESFETCLKDQKLLEGITAVRKRASEKFGVKSTPTLFINGKMLKGARDIGAIESMMNLDN